MEAMERPEEYSKVFPPRCKTSKDRFLELDTARGPLLDRCDQYAAWTLPSVFPPANFSTESMQMQGPNDSIGAQAVNNLANTIVNVMYPMYSPFMRLKVDDNRMTELKYRAMEEGDPEAKMILDNLDSALSTKENEAMRLLNFNKFRTQATYAAKLLLITGNALPYFPQQAGTNSQVYSIRDYVLSRDLNGEVVELITRDRKKLSTLAPSIQDQIRVKRVGDQDADKDVSLYTELKLHTDGRFYMRQFADDVELDSQGIWPKDELPWLPLTWNLNRGEDYGRGLVEDYAGAFHGIDVLSVSFVDIVGSCADIKWLVNPASNLDVKELNDSDSGTYHEGVEGDIIAVQVNKASDLAVVVEKLNDWRQQIGRAFLLFSAVQRDAERVTAEEVRRLVGDLEAQHSGIYARLADEWQMPVAKMLMRRVKVEIDGTEVYPEIITGLETLSRAGDMDNLHLWIADMNALQAMPESLISVVDPLRYARFCAIRRGVDHEKFLKSPDQMIQEQQQAMAMQQQMQQNEVAGQVAADAVASEQ